MTMPRLVNAKLALPPGDVMYGQIEANAKYGRRMLGSRSVVICGAGPSLADEYQRLPKTDQIWACNSALPYLMDRKIPVSHGLCIDHSDGMLREWDRTFDVDYYLASSCHPKLVEHLANAGRHLSFFHSYIGLPDPDGWTREKPEESYEHWLYTHRFRTSVQVGYGLNAVPRAVCLAVFLGFQEIVLVGSDCACKADSPPMPVRATVALDGQELVTPEYAEWMQGLVMYADGRTAGQCYGPGEMLAEGIVDGTRWVTRPDMVISARHILDLMSQYPGKIRLQGRTLVSALASQPESFMEDMPKLSGVGEVSNFGNAALPPTIKLHMNGHGKVG